MFWRRLIPWFMVAFRAIAGAAIALVALRMASHELGLGILIAAGFLSDVYDGILARRWGTATPALRIADSAIDTFFYLCVLAAIVARHWPALHERLWWFGVLIAFEAARYIFDFLKFRRIASYHSYASKLWGALLAATTITLLCFNSPSLLTPALILGILCNLEGLMMSALLPQWTHDVKTLSRALILRREMMARVAVS